MRPLFPKGYDRETQIIATVLSADRDNDPDMLSLIAASAALLISDIPHTGPVASVRMGRVEGKIVGQSYSTELEGSDVSIVVAASPEYDHDARGRRADRRRRHPDLEALYMAHDAMAPIFEMQEELQRLAGKPKRAFTPKELDKEVFAAVRERVRRRNREDALAIKEKKAASREACTRSGESRCRTRRRFRDALLRPRKRSARSIRQRRSALSCVRR